MASYNGGQPGEMTTEFADWESAVLGIAAYKIVKFTAPTYNDALLLACDMTTRHGVDFISIDTNACNLQPHQIVALNNVGFYVASHYIDWVMDVLDTAKRTAKFLGRYPSRDIIPNDCVAVSAIARSVFRASRFMVDPLIPSGYGERIYAAWGANSCSGYVDFGIVCLIGDEVVGFATAKRPDVTPSVKLDLLGVAEEYLGQGIGMSLLAEITARLHLGGIVSAGIRTEVYNNSINAICKSLHIPIVGAGLVLHWVSENIGRTQ